MGRLSRAGWALAWALVVLLSLPAAGQRARVLVTTDGEVDDQCSLVRLLLYANEFDLEGLIYTSSVFHSVASGNWAGTDWIQATLTRYAEVYPSLAQHDGAYPAPELLLQRVFVGNIASTGDMSTDTPGADRIAQVLLDEDKRPVLLLSWGGNNTIARALERIRQHQPEQMARVCRKARLVFTLNQDSSLEDSIWPNWPDLVTIGAYGGWKGIGYTTSLFVPPEQGEYYASSWMLEHVTVGHGALCSFRPGASGGLFIGEGDSVTFLYALPVGLRGLVEPGLGSWGGRYELEAGSQVHWQDALDDFDVTKPVWRWAPAYQRDLAARADWCVMSPEEANHPPLVRLDGEADQIAAPGQGVSLSATATDPDDDELAYRWWYYPGPSLSAKAPVLQSADSPRAVLVVPTEAREGDRICIVCEVTDSGSPPLTRYAQVTVRVTGAPPREEPSFVLGINFGGPDTLIGGNAWLGMERAQAQGLRVEGASALTRTEVPMPFPGEATSAMLQSTITAEKGFSLAQPLDDGRYDVYLWVFEWGDFYWSFARCFDVALEGRVAGRNLGALRTLGWRNYGPFDVMVSDGELNVEARGKSRPPQLSGLSLYLSRPDY